jgi:hypothetical protein
MRPVTDPVQVRHYQKLAAEMTTQRENEEGEFNPDWVRSQDWKVVPVESGARIPSPEISRLVAALKRTGCVECIAIATEPLGDMPTCYLLSTDEADFRELNQTLGVFRFLITDERRSWAISCNEWYNLFASKPALLEELLGKPIEHARVEYLRFASELAESPDEPLLRVAKQYASL